MSLTVAFRNFIVKVLLPWNDASLLGGRFLWQVEYAGYGYRPVQRPGAYQDL